MVNKKNIDIKESATYRHNKDTVHKYRGVYGQIIQ